MMSEALRPLTSMWTAKIKLAWETKRTSGPPARKGLDGGVGLGKV
jgi:hypothetical protein